MVWVEGGGEGERGGGVREGERDGEGERGGGVREREREADDELEVFREDMVFKHERSVVSC